MMNENVSLSFSGKTAEISRGSVLMEALAAFSYFPETPCGGRGFCGKCLVEIEDSIGRRKVKSCVHRLVENTEVFIREGETYNEIAYGRAEAFAVDIGTTIVKMSAYDGTEFCDMPSFVNPQRIHGYDVISRIASGKYEEMRKLIRTAIASKIRSYTGKAASEKVARIAVSGNTLMISLFAGIDPSIMGRAPYAAPIDQLDGVETKFSELNDLCRVTLLPCHSSFLGADFLSCAYFAKEKYGNKSFFCDMGTNAEMAFIDGGKINAASVPLGPAVEGMNLSCGMTASSGAVIGISGIVPHHSMLLYAGNTVLGIAGSGYIDAVSVLLKSGIIDKSGKMISGVTEKEGEKRFYFADGVYISQKDIRSIQLVKASCRAGAEMLSDKSGCSFDHLKYFILSGTFGSKITPRSMFDAGFFPAPSEASIETPGNLSLRSAEEAVVFPDHIIRMKELRADVNIVNLGGNAEFGDKFISSADF